jgi:DUF1016 N-terminal domain
MKQFYEIYQGDSIVSPLIRQLPWSHHLIILGQSKRREERKFYPGFRQQTQFGMDWRQVFRQATVPAYAVDRKGYRSRNETATKLTARWIRRSR